MVTTWQNIPEHLATQAEDAQRGTIGTDTSRHHQPASRVHDGAVRHTAGQEQAEHTGRATHTVSFDGTAGGSILGSLQRVTGAPSVELEPGNPSSRTSVEVAIRMGLLHRDANGNLKEAERMAPEEQPGQAAKQEQAGDPAAYVDAEEEALWAEDIAPLPQHAYDAAGPSLIGAVVRGDSFDDTAKALAHNASIPLELAAEYVTEGFEKGRRLVDRALAPMGLTGARLEAFYEAARERPQELQDAMQRVFHGNDASGFRAMATAWAVQNPGDLSHFRAAGFETSIDRETGGVLVRRAGGPWVNASELGK
jgi:hypothetical protein